MNRTLLIVLCLGIGLAGGMVAGRERARSEAADEEARREAAEEVVLGDVEAMIHEGGVPYRVSPTPVVAWTFDGRRTELQTRPPEGVGRTAVVHMRVNGKPLTVTAVIPNRGQ